MFACTNIIDPVDFTPKMHQPRIRIYICLQVLFDFFTKFIRKYLTLQIR